MLEMINEPVDVIVAFVNNRVAPKRLRWNRRDYDIKTVNLMHTAHEGAKKIFYFSVSDMTNYFKLRLDTENLEWRLIELSTG